MIVCKSLLLIRKYYLCIRIYQGFFQSVGYLFLRLKDELDLFGMRFYVCFYIVKVKQRES